MKVSTNKREENYVSGLTITPKIQMEKPVGLVLERAQSIEGKGLVFEAKLHKKEYVGLILEVAQSVEGNLPLKLVPARFDGKFFKNEECFAGGYQSSDHFGAIEEHEDNVVQKLEKDEITSPSKASILAARAISIEVGNKGDEQEDDVQLEGSPNGIEQHGEFQIR
ncbi:Hypothetical predicted protein [Olea europaea subsp. europaea]|uniref:Uncharacterized protein n=1 Tax=Olea europaea subsp. europaea TaxID=158383 RepID=A0A8S0VAN1_OLEEU|nr:Hypothetical predicted protein [Olea europaea subsp. europaea]